MRRGSEGCSLAQVGCGMAQRGDEWLSGVRRGSVLGRCGSEGCGVAQVGCGMAQRGDECDSEG